MKTSEQLNLPADIKYTPDHVWLKNDGETLLAGISDYAQDQLGEVSFVDMPQAGARFAADEEFGSVESVKSVNGLFMPVSGTIVEVNTALEDTPTLINTSCYAEGWIVRIMPDNKADAETLLSAEAYKVQL